VIYDKNRVVLSLPPIINSNHSKITLNTRNVFIEVTATDLTKAGIVLNTVCAMFSEYCADKFCVEAVDVVSASGVSSSYPDLSTRLVEANLDYVTSGVGIKLDAHGVIKLLEKMSLHSILAEDKQTLKVSVPCTRSDILHACDIMEDVAIAYGFNNLEKISPSTTTQGKQQILNKVSNMIRQEVAMAGFTEILTLALCSREENYKLLGRLDDALAVTIANPKTLEFQIARTTMLVGLLKTVKENKKTPLPLKLFELSDVVMKDSKTDVGSSNKRNLCAVYCAQTSGFEVIHGLLDRVMLLNRVQWKESSQATPKGDYYHLKSSDDPAFLHGRSCDILLNENKIGVIGVLHPQVLENYHIPFPCSAFEICIEQFV